MTPDEIKAMTDEQIDKAISGWKDGYDRYSTDLNAAWPLMFDEHGEVPDSWFDNMQAVHGMDMPPVPDPRRCARLICEAYLWLKTKGAGRGYTRRELTGIDKAGNVGRWA